VANARRAKVRAYLEGIHRDPKEVGQAAERLRGADVRVVVRQDDSIVEQHHCKACRWRTLPLLKGLDLLWC